MHQFEVFRRDAVGSRVKPIVTIQRRGLIAMNAAAYRAIGSPVAVELLYSTKRRVAAVRPVDRHAPHAYLVRATSRSAAGSFVVSASAFVRYYELDKIVPLRRAAVMSGNMLCFELDAADESAVANSVDSADSAQSSDDHDDVRADGSAAGG